MPQCGNSTPTINSIVLVGGLLMRGAPEGGPLSQTDDARLKHVFQICAQRKIGIAPDAKISVANLAYGYDFLKTETRADMIVFSYIFFVERMIGKTTDAFVHQSPLAADKNLWHQKLVESGAHTAFNIYAGAGEYELPTEFINRQPFRLIETPPQNTHMKFALLQRRP